MNDHWFWIFFRLFRECVEDVGREDSLIKMLDALLRLDFLFFEQDGGITAFSFFVAAAVYFWIHRKGNEDKSKNQAIAEFHPE